LAGDISVTDFTANGRNLLVSYDIGAEAAPAFNISVYRSADGVTRDALIGSHEVTLETDRAAGPHTIEIAPDFLDVREDYRLIAVADPTGAIAETSETNNELSFAGGAFRAADGVVHLHGTDVADSVRIDSSATGSADATINITVDDRSMEYNASTLSEIHLRLHGGEDVLNVQPNIRHNIHAFAGAGNDRVLSGAGSDWLVGGAGDDFIAGRGNRDLIHGDDTWREGGDDTLLGGADNDTLEGFAGNDKLIGGRGLDITSGGDGDDIVDGGNDDDLVWSGKGRDRIVNPPGRDEPRDEASDDAILATTPEELIFAEFSDEGGASLRESESMESGALGASSEEYGFSGTVGPLWMEPVFGNTTYHAEGLGSGYQFWPFEINREDQFGAVVDFELGYGGAASGSDLNYKQTSVSVGQSASVEIRANDDDVWETTEDFTAWFSSAVVPSDPGAFVIVDYPSTGQPSTDPDGDPFSATGYIVDGELTPYDSRGALDEPTEESGAFLQVGEPYPLDILLKDYPNATDDYILTYPSSIVVRHNGSVFPSGSVISSLNTGFEIEAVAPVSNAVVSLDWMAGWNGGMVDRVRVSAGFFEVTAPEGEVVLVNDQDVDHDGFVDYVDGFDNLFNSASDDYGTGEYFVPISIYVDGDAPIASLTFDYFGSDPRGVTATLDQPYVLPPGGLRLWLVDGNQARSGASIAQGGHYVAPGTYTPQQLGIIPGQDQTVTVYVEGIRESTSVGDAAISIESTFANGVTAIEAVDLTAVRFEVLGRGYGEYFMEPVYHFSTTHTLYPNKPEWEAVGMMRGTYQSYKINVYDPRLGLSQVQLAGYNLNLTREGNRYTTSEFILPQALSDVPSGLVPLSIIGTDVSWQFNPGGNRRIVHPIQLNDWDTDLAAEIVKVIDEMKAANWPSEPVSDDGAFGRHVHALVAQRFGNEAGWKTDLWIEPQTNKILHIGPTFNAPAGTIQVDIVKLVDSYDPVAGEILDHTKLKDVYDVKTSLTGRIPAAQKTNLTNVLNGWSQNPTRTIKSAMAPARYKKIGGWEVNKNFGNGIRIFGLLAGSTTAIATAHAMWSFDEFDPDFQAMINEARLIRGMTNEVQKKYAVPVWLAGDVKPFLQKFTAGSTAADLAVTALVYKTIGEIE
jgi:hypothetical protein